MCTVNILIGNASMELIVIDISMLGVFMLFAPLSGSYFFQGHEVITIATKSSR